MFNADPVTGNFPGWEYLSLIAALLLLTLSVLFFLLFLRRVRQNRLFSYRTVAFLGLALFLIIPAFFRFRYFFRYAFSGTFYEMLAGILFSAQTFLVTSAPVAAAFALLLLVSNVFLILREGFALNNLYAFVAAVLILLGTGFGCFIVLFDNIRFSSNIFPTVYSACFCYFECLMASVIVCTLTAGLRNPAFNKDLLLILGCRVRPDGTLYPLIRGRVDRALSFAAAQEAVTGKAPVFLPTGGKGSDESCSEGEAMRRYLLSQGIPEDRILAETESVDTEQNMKFSKVLADANYPGAEAAFCTTGFHVFRSGMLSRAAGWNLDGFGAPTVWYFWPNAFIREFLGLLWESKRQHVSVLLLVSAFFAGITFLI